MSLGSPELEEVDKTAKIKCMINKFNSFKTLTCCYLILFEVYVKSFYHIQRHKVTEIKTYGK